MNSLAETIDSALASIGSKTEGKLRSAIDAFEKLALDDEEHIAALATAVAAVASTYHKRHVPVYLEALRSWSIEIAEASPPPATKLRYVPDCAIIERGASQLLADLNVAIEEMRGCGLDVRDRLVTELAVVARLLGRHDPRTISIALMAAGRALADPHYRPGHAVMVPLRELPALTPEFYETKAAVS